MNDRAEVLGGWLNLVQAHAVMTGALEDRLQRTHGLSLAEHEVLVRLYRAAERRLPMRDVADLVLLSRSGITRLADRLEHRGLIERRPDDEDRRLTHAVLTSAGASAVEASYPDFEAGVAEVFGNHLSATDIASLRRALRKVLAGNTAWEDQRCNAAIPEGASA